MGYPMASGNLIFQKQLFPLEVSIATNLLLYLVQSAVFMVAIGNSLINDFNVGYFLKDGYPVLVCFVGLLFFF